MIHNKEVNLVQFEPNLIQNIEAFKSLPEVKPKSHLQLVKNDANKSSLIVGGGGTKIQRKINKGGRNGAVFRYLSGLRGFGHCEDSIRAQAHYYNEENCNPRLEGEEIERIVKQAMKYEQGELPSFNDFTSNTLNQNDGLEGNIFKSWGELRKIPIERMSYLFYGVSRGDVCMFEAVTNYGKSTFLRNLAINLSCGLGYLNITEKGKPLRVTLPDYETSLERFRQDINTMVSSLTDEQQKLVEENFFPYCAKMRGNPILNLSDPKHLETLEAEIIANEIDVVIIDTLSTAFAMKSENDNSEATNGVMKPLNDLAARTNTAIVFAHHIGKVGLEAGSASNHVHRARGASAFGGMSAAIYRLDVKQNGEGKPVTVLSMPKVKDEPKDEMVIEINLETRRFEAVENVETFNASEENYRKMLEVITQPMTYQEIECANAFFV